MLPHTIATFPIVTLHNPDNLDTCQDIAHEGEDMNTSVHAQQPGISPYRQNLDDAKTAASILASKLPNGYAVNSHEALVFERHVLTDVALIVKKLLEANMGQMQDLDMFYGMPEPGDDAKVLFQNNHVVMSGKVDAITPHGGSVDKTALRNELTKLGMEDEDINDLFDKVVKPRSPSKRITFAVL